MNIKVRNLLPLFPVIDKRTGIPGLWTQELDAGLTMLDSGRWTLDPRLWMLDDGLWTLESGHWTLDVGL